MLAILATLILTPILAALFYRATLGAPIGVRVPTNERKSK
jgi:hypothetical protein